MASVREPLTLGVVAPAEQLNSPDTVRLAVTGAAGKKTLAHPGRATAVNCLALITFVDASSSLPIQLFSGEGRAP